MNNYRVTRTRKLVGWETATFLIVAKDEHDATAAAMFTNSDTLNWEWSEAEPPCEEQDTIEKAE